MAMAAMAHTWGPDGPTTLANPLVGSNVCPSKLFGCTKIPGYSQASVV